MYHWNRDDKRYRKTSYLLVDSSRRQCGGLLGGNGRIVACPPPRTNQTGPPPIIYAVGERIDPIGKVNFRDTPATLVMFLRENCNFCRQSLPFYHRLTTAAQKASGKSLRFVVASPDDSRPMTSYLGTHGISVAEVVHINQGDVKIPGTPTLSSSTAAGRSQRCGVDGCHRNQKRGCSRSSDYKGPDHLSKW